MACPLWEYADARDSLILSSDDDISITMVDPEQEPAAPRSAYSGLPKRNGQLSDGILPPVFLVCHQDQVCGILAWSGKPRHRRGAPRVQSDETQHPGDADVVQSTHLRRGN